MNREWMRERLDSFKKLCEEYQTMDRMPGDHSDALVRIGDEMAPQVPTIREILKRLDSELARQVTEPDYTSGAFDSLRAVQ
jgi:hypothetical protein